MKDYTIAETYTLPSEGKLYTPNIIPTVTIRSMTTQEEQKRLASSAYPYKMLCSIIDDCIVDDIGMSSYDMCLGDYQFLLHKLRIVTYGADYNMTVQCPFCGTISDEVINLDDLRVIKFSPEILTYTEFELPQSKLHVKLNIQTPRMLDKVNEKVRDFSSKTKGNNVTDRTLTFMVASLIKEIDGEVPDKFKLDELVAHLPMRDINTIISHAEKINDGIGIDTHFTFECSTCNLTKEMNMSMTQEFFRPALNI